MDTEQKRTNGKIMDKSLRFMCLIITFLALGMMIIRFFTHGEYPPSGIEALYIGILSTYSIHRKTLQFTKKTTDKRPDQLFVCVWFSATTILYIINFLSKGYFCPSEDMDVLSQMTRITLEVAGIFVLSHGANMIQKMRDK